MRYMGKRTPAIFTVTVSLMQAGYAGQGMLEQLQMIDGYGATFQITAAEKEQEMGGSHNVMINVKKDGKVLTDVTVNSKVIYPGGKAETKMVMGRGNWYMAGYGLGHAGKSQVMALFKTADGVKRNGGVYYPGD